MLGLVWVAGFGEFDVLEISDDDSDDVVLELVEKIPSIRGSPQIGPNPREFSLPMVLGPELVFHPRKQTGSRVVRFSRTRDLQYGVGFFIPSRLDEDTVPHQIRLGTSTSSNRK